MCTEEKNEVQNEAEGKIGFKKLVPLCLVTGVLITALAVMCAPGVKEAVGMFKELYGLTTEVAVNEEQSENTHLEHIAQCFKNVMDLNDEEITLVFEDPGNHFVAAYGWEYIDETYVTGLSEDEDVVICYFTSKGVDYYAVSESEKLEPYNYNAVEVIRSIEDDNHAVKFDSSNTSLKSIDTFGIYNKETKVLYIQKN